MQEAKGSQQLEHYRTKSTIWLGSYLMTQTRDSFHSQVSRQNALFCKKMTFHIPHVSYYKYPYTHEMCKVAIKKKTVREIPPY